MARCPSTPCRLPHSLRLNAWCVRVPGLANGNLFSRVMANSPGGILPVTPRGQPPVYVSAGVQDNIFPISQGGDSVGAHHPIATAKGLSVLAARASHIVIISSVWEVYGQ